MTLYVGSEKIKDLGDYGVYYGSTPIEKIYNGSQLVYEWNPYNPNTVFYNNGNIGTATWSGTLKKGVYKIRLVGGGEGADNGYYYWPAGGRGGCLEVTFYIDETKSAYAYIGAGGSGFSTNGTASYFNLDNVRIFTAVGGTDSAVANTINSSAVKIISTTVNNSSNTGGNNGQNQTSFTPWGDGGYTYNESGRGGGFRLEWLRLNP